MPTGFFMPVCSSICQYPSAQVPLDEILCWRLLQKFVTELGKNKIKISGTLNGAPCVCHIIGSDIMLHTDTQNALLYFHGNTSVFITLLTVTRMSMGQRKQTVAFSWKQRLCKRATTLCYTYVAYPPFFFFVQ